MKYQLKPFEENKLFSVDCDLNVLDSLIEVCFYVRGDLDKLYIPAPNTSDKRLDNLWKRTCFETFVKSNDQLNYFEINASPTGDWALYKFSDYHADMADASEVREFRVQSSADQKELKCWYTIDLKKLGLPNKNLDIGLSCILENNEKKLSFWAVNHKKEKPDFHLASNFIHI
jgi:hypothetical protein